MISKDKEYTTRDGREVRVYATDGGGAYPVHGAVLNNNLGWRRSTWTQDGYYCGGDLESNADLIEKPKTKKFWIEVWMTTDGNIDSLVHYSEASVLAAKGCTEGIGFTRLEIIEREYPVKTEER